MPRLTHLPIPGVQQLSEATKQAVIADCIAGIRQSDIAKRHKIHAVTVSKWWNRFKSLKPQGIDSGSPIEHQKQGLVTPAFEAVKAGLECTKNAYQRANIGVQVLKGLQIFAPDQATSIQVLASGIPTDWRSMLPTQQVSAITSSSTLPALPAPQESTTQATS